MRRLWSVRVEQPVMDLVLGAAFRLNHPALQLANWLGAPPAAFPVAKVVAGVAPARADA